mgnify:CR=1 FL=1
MGARLARAPRAKGQSRISAGGDDPHLAGLAVHRTRRPTVTWGLGLTAYFLLIGLLATTLASRAELAATVPPDLLATYERVDIALDPTTWPPLPPCHLTHCPREAATSRTSAALPSERGSLTPPPPAGS